MKYCSPRIMFYHSHKKTYFLEFFGIHCSYSSTSNCSQTLTLILFLIFILILFIFQLSQGFWKTLCQSEIYFVFILFDFLLWKMVRKVFPPVLVQHLQQLFLYRNTFTYPRVAIIHSNVWRMFLFSSTVSQLHFQTMSF